MSETVKELIEFSELWFNDVEEGEPIAEDEIELVKDLITALKSQLSITELAVKGFQMLKAMSSKEDIPAALYNTASWYLDEIANLEVKNAQT